MRAELILPAALTIVLLGMVVYSTTGTTDALQLAGREITCRTADRLATLDELHEASGLAASRRERGLFWAHNDSSDPVVLGIASDGSLRARVRIAQAAVDDWEAITTAPCGSGSCILIGDIGDNDMARRTIKVYRVPEPAVTDEATDAAEVIEARYPEGAHDAEGMFFAEGVLYVVTKGERGPIRLYKFPNLDAGTVHTLQLVATVAPEPVDKPFRVTDAAISPDGRWVALRSTDLVLFHEARALLSGRPGTPLAADVRALNEPQGEGIAWADTETLFVAGEGGRGGTFGRISCNLPR